MRLPRLYQVERLLPRDPLFRGDALPPDVERASFEREAERAFGRAAMEHASVGQKLHPLGAVLRATVVFMSEAEYRELSRLAELGERYEGLCK